MTPPRRLVVPAVALPLVAVLLAGCTDAGAERPTPGSPPKTSEPARDDAVDAAELTAELLEDPEPPEVLATATGTVVGAGAQPVEVTAEVLAVEATAHGTRLRWRLSSTSGEPVSPYGFSLATATLVDTRSITVRDPAGEQSLMPYLTRTPTNESVCMCSTMPSLVDGTGEEMNALFPPLDEGTTVVEVVLPGFGPLVDVAVTR